MLRGEQFDGLFFTHGLLLSTTQLSDFVQWAWANYLGIGVIAGLLGGVRLVTTHRPIFIVWLVWVAPYTYFYLTYGAGDRYLMLGPTYLVWTIPFAVGLAWILADQAKWLRQGVALALPLLFLFVNFPLVNLSHDDSARQRAEAQMGIIPQNAIVLGDWWDIVPLQYLQMVEDVRPDLRLSIFFCSGNIKMIWNDLSMGKPIARNLLFS